KKQRTLLHARLTLFRFEASSSIYPQLALRNQYSKKTCKRFAELRTFVLGKDSDLEAFSHNPTDLASRQWPFDQARVPLVRTCGSSRTEQDFPHKGIFTTVG